MDDKLFKQLLSQYTEWHQPRDLHPVSKKRRGRPRTKDLDSTSEYDLEPPSTEPNPTLPPLVTKVKCSAEACVDCGKICENGRHIDYKIMINRQGKKFVKPNCVTCGLHQDPVTKKFELNGTQASIKWNNYAKPVTRPYVFKSKDLEPNAETVFEDHNEIITKYPETKSQK